MQGAEGNSRHSDRNISLFPLLVGLRTYQHPCNILSTCKAPKEIHAILKETLVEHVPLYATVKNRVAQFKRGDFSTCDAPRPGRPATVITPEIIDRIQDQILKDRKVGPEMPKRGSKTSNVPAV